MIVLQRVLRIKGGTRMLRLWNALGRTLEAVTFDQESFNDLDALRKKDVPVPAYLRATSWKGSEWRS